MLTKPHEELGSPLVPFCLFFGEGSRTRIDYRKQIGTLILTSLLEDLEELGPPLLTTYADAPDNSIARRVFLQPRADSAAAVVAPAAAA